MLDKTSEKNIIGGREAQESGVNIIDFDPPAARDNRPTVGETSLAHKLGKELGRGAMGIVYEIRTEERRRRRYDTESHSISRMRRKDILLHDGKSANLRKIQNLLPFCPKWAI